MRAIVCRCEAGRLWRGVCVVRRDSSLGKTFVMGNRSWKLDLSRSCIKHVSIGRPQTDPKGTHSSVDEISRDMTFAKVWGNSRLVRGLERRDNVSSEGKVVGSPESPTRVVYSFEARFRCRRDRFAELQKGVQRLLEARDNEVRPDWPIKASI